MYSLFQFYWKVYVWKTGSAYKVPSSSVWSCSLVCMDLFKSYQPQLHSFEVIWHISYYFNWICVVFQHPSGLILRQRVLLLSFILHSSSFLLPASFLHFDDSTDFSVLLSFFIWWLAQSISSISFWVPSVFSSLEISSFRLSSCESWVLLFPLTSVSSLCLEPCDGSPQEWTVWEAYLSSWEGNFVRPA